MLTAEEFAKIFGPAGGQGGPAPLPPPGLPGAPTSAAPAPPPPPPPPLASAAAPGSLEAYWAGLPPPAPPAGGTWKDMLPPGGDAPATTAGPGEIGGPKHAPLPPPSAMPVDKDPGGWGNVPLAAPKPQPMIGSPNDPGPKTLPTVTLAGPSPQARAAGGGGGDFGAGAIRKDLYGTFKNEQTNIQDAATIERAKADALAAGNAVIAQDRMADAARRQGEAEHQEAIFQAYQEDTQRQLDEVRNRTVDPNRLYKDRGQQTLAIIGGVLGGMYMGLNKLTSNPFIDQMNRNIDRDIALQENELARDTKAVSERRNLLGDMRATYKDKEYAKLQAKNLYYEGIKEALAAEAATYDSPAIQVRANQAINGVQRQQDALKLQEAAQRAAQAAAGAAFARAQAKEEREYKLKAFEADTHRIAAERSGAKGETLASRFVPTGQDEKGVVGFLAPTTVEAGKVLEKRMAREELRAEINNALKIRESEGGLGRTLNRNNPDDFLQLYTPEWQTLIRQSQASLTAAKNKASGLGAFDKGTEALLAREIGDLESRGSQSDVRLRGLLAQLERADEADNQRIGGPKVRRNDDETIELLGGTHAPNNPHGSTGVRRKTAE